MLLLQYFCPEAFASPLLTGWYAPEGNHGWLGGLLAKQNIHASSLMGTLKQGVWIALAFAVAGVDWPVRQLSKGRLFPAFGGSRAGARLLVDRLHYFDSRGSHAPRRSIQESLRVLGVSKHGQRILAPVPCPPRYPGRVVLLSPTPPVLLAVQARC